MNIHPIDCYKEETTASRFISIHRYYIIHKVLVEQIARASFCLESARVRDTQKLRINPSIQEHENDMCHRDTHVGGRSTY